MPEDAATVVMNVTVTGPASNGYVTVHPCGSTVPLASNLNYSAGQTIPNLVFARIGTGGKVCIYTSSTADLVADVSGFFPAAVDYRSYDVPTRLIDTRAGKGAPLGPLRAGSVLDFALGGGGVVNAGPIVQAAPGQPSSMVLNVTATNPAAAGYLTVFPCGAARPVASNVNFTAGQTIANLAIVKLDQSLHFCVFSLVDTDVVVDAAGYFPAGQSGYTPLAQPARILDTRVPVLTPTSFGDLQEGGSADAAVAAGLLGPVTRFCDLGGQQYGLQAYLPDPTLGRVDVRPDTRTISSIQIRGSGMSTREGVRIGDTWAAARLALLDAGYTATTFYDSFTNITYINAMPPGDPSGAYVGVLETTTFTVTMMASAPWNYCS